MAVDKKLYLGSWFLFSKLFSNTLYERPCNKRKQGLLGECVTNFSVNCLLQVHNIQQYLLNILKIDHLPDICFRCSSGFDRHRQDWVDNSCPDEVSSQ